MLPQDRELDELFHALSDSTRRGILMRVRDKDRTVNEIASQFEISLPAISKHLDVLERAGLISRRKYGRTRICHVEPGHLQGAQEWLEFYQGFWGDRLDRLKLLVEQEARKTPNSRRN